MYEFYMEMLISTFSFAIDTLIFDNVGKIFYLDNMSYRGYNNYQENQKIKKFFNEKCNLEYSKLLADQLDLINVYAKHIRFINKETIDKITNYLDLNFFDYLISIYNKFFKENPEYKSISDHFTIDIYPFISDKNAYNIYLVPNIQGIISYYSLNSDNKLYEIYQELVKNFLDENSDIVITTVKNFDDKECLLISEEFNEFLEKNIYKYKSRILENVTFNECKKIIEKLTEYVNNKIDLTVETIKLADSINSTNNVVL